MMLRIMAICLLGPSMVSAQSLCGVTQDVFDRIAGDWAGQIETSFDNEIISLMRSDPLAVTVSDGTIDLPVGRDTTGGPLDLVLQVTPVYDVDQVDDILDATGNGAVMDAVADTPCGPENLPQMTALIPEAKGISVAGRITLIGYFDDRLLFIRESTLKSDETAIFMTATGLLQRQRAVVP